MIRTILFTICFTCLNIHAQKISDEITASEDGMEYLYSRIQQIDGFIDEFNKGNLDLLMDQNYNYPDIDALINKAKDHTLDFYDTSWVAKVNCLVQYQGIEQKLDLFLKVKTSPPDMRSKWEVVAADAKFLDISAECPDSTTFLPPSANGTNFMMLKRVFETKANMAAYTNLEIQNQQLPIFLFLIKSNQLKFKEVLKTQYYFGGFESKIFRVSYFSRIDDNSGWLIDEIFNKSEIEAGLLLQLLQGR